MTAVEPKRAFQVPRPRSTVLAAVPAARLGSRRFFSCRRGNTPPTRPGANRAGDVPTSLPSCSAVAAGRRRGRSRRGVARRRPASPPGRRAERAGARRWPHPGENCVDTSLHLPASSSLWERPAERPFYGRRGRATGFVGPWENGVLYGSAAIFLFVLAVGAFITVTMKTEGDSDRDRQARSALPLERLRADRDP